MKTKIVREGQPCAKCGTPVVRRSHNAPSKPDQRYFFTHWFACPDRNCGALYMVERARRAVERTAQECAAPKPLCDVQLYTDGSARPNPGRGGWSAILVRGSAHKELRGSCAYTTNNAMELTAVLRGLQALRAPCRVTVITDSRNVIGWLDGGWRRRDPAVRVLCAEIRRIAREGGHELAFEKITGLAGHAENERCHTLAQQARDEVRQ